MTYNITIDDYIGRWGYSKQYIRNQLSNYKGKPVNVRISSLGGAVDDGLDIRQQFIDHGDVTAYLYGMVASSATILALGAKKVCISKYSMFLIHKVSNWVDAWGNYNADQIEALIEQLKANKLENDKFDLVLANMYANKCKKKIDEILPVLKEGRWLTAQEALDYGFVDEIIEDQENNKVDFLSANSKLNVLGLPELPLPASPTNDEDASDLDEGLFNRFAAWWERKRNKNNSTILPTVTDNNDNPKSDMKTNYLKVNTLLNVEGLEFEDGKVALTEEQIKATNDNIDRLESESPNQKTTLDEQNTQIENQKNGDGGVTTHIEGEGEGDKGNAMESAQDMYNSVKDLI